MAVANVVGPSDWYSWVKCNHVSRALSNNATNAPQIVIYMGKGKPAGFVQVVVTGTGMGSHI